MEQNLKTKKLNSLSHARSGKCDLCGISAINSIVPFKGKMTCFACLMEDEKVEREEFLFIDCDEGYYLPEGILSSSTSLLDDFLRSFDHEHDGFLLRRYEREFDEYTV